MSAVLLCSSYYIARKFQQRKLSRILCLVFFAKIVFFTNLRKFSLLKVSSYTVCQYVSLLHILWMVSIMTFCHCMLLTVHSSSVAHCSVSIFLQISQYLVILDSYTDTSICFLIGWVTVQYHLTLDCLPGNLACPSDLPNFCIHYHTAQLYIPNGILLYVYLSVYDSSLLLTQKTNMQEKSQDCSIS